MGGMRQVRKHGTEWDHMGLPVPMTTLHGITYEIILKSIKLCA